MGKFEKKRIIVTGAGGLIGSAVVRRLYNKGKKVVALYKTPPSEAAWEKFKIDLSDKNSKEALKQLLSEAICLVHCAAVLPSFFHDSLEAAKVNRQIDDLVVDCCHKADVGLIYMSGTSLYADSTNVIINENAHLSPLGDYLNSKIKTENNIKKNIKVYKIMRISAPYGPMQKNRSVLRIFIENALSNKDIRYFGSGEREQDFTHVNDVASAVVAAVNNPSFSGVYNVASGKAISMRKLGHLILECIPESKSVVLPADIPDPQENYRARFSIEKARRILGWQPEISLRDGIAEWASVLRSENRNYF